MNKRFMEFLHDLAEENERLESSCRIANDDKEMLRETLLSQIKEIKQLKAKLRQLKKNKNEQINNGIIN